MQKTSTFTRMDMRVDAIISSSSRAGLKSHMQTFSTIINPKDGGLDVDAVCPSAMGHRNLMSNSTVDDDSQESSTMDGDAQGSDNSGDAQSSDNSGDASTESDTAGGTASNTISTSTLAIAIAIPIGVLLALILSLAAFILLGIKKGWFVRWGQKHQKNCNSLEAEKAGFGAFNNGGGENAPSNGKSFNEVVSTVSLTLMELHGQHRPWQMGGSEVAAWGGNEVHQLHGSDRERP
ncbi:hypothetical protein K431DRAFT_294691 [Polychaeton citri CBS 116435]|uniref:Uncharacterized protein n=1 Tax=Polychaeton citri CBS 116435 TaxID=1314669 RepID=A0A9P4Q856_9PEZI|nr:hypothetical protein K431DRAFT_294691 [Polychaeton citri CBS 116435]